MRRLLLSLALVPIAVFSRDTNRYESVVRTADGVELSQRGGLGPSNFVVTAVSYGDLFEDIRTNETGVAAEGFKRAVDKYAPSLAQDFDATKLENLPAFYDNLRTNRTPAARFAFSNAVASVASTAGSDGAARPFPKYLHSVDFYDSYPDEAKEYYRLREAEETIGGCSAVRDGGFLYRNFDYPFDERAEFVVKMSAGKDRFASVGVAQVGTNLTEAIVTSGKPSKWYKSLPGATVDGINENGVVVNINVVDGDPHEAGWPTTGEIHCLAAVRWVLDNATNAASAASVLAADVYFPVGWTQNYHYMIADERETWVVENGRAARCSALIYKTMTNFRVVHISDDDASYNPFATMLEYYADPTFAHGLERFGLLYNGANITNAWYTRAYRRETVPQWKSEFSADVLARTNEIFNAWAEHPKEYFRGKTNNGEPWWQTVHTSVYDIQNRILRLAVQETDDWYVFQVPSVGKVKSVNGFTGDVNLGASDVGALPVGHVDERIVSTNMTLRSGYPGRTEMNADGSITERPDPAYAVHENPIPYIPNTITGTTTRATAGTILTYEYDGVSGGVHSWTCRLEPQYWTDTWYGYSCPSNLLFRSSDETWVMRTGNGQSVDFPTADFSPYKVMTAQANLVGSYRMGSRTMVWKAAPATWSSVQASGYTPSYPQFETNVFPVTRTKVLRRDDISDWALQPAKPAYTPFEIGALPFSRYLTTKTYLADYDHIDCFGLGSVYYNASLEMESNGSAYENFFSITRQGGMASDWVPLITNTQYRSEGIRHRCYRTSFGTLGTFDYFLWFPHEDGTIATREWVRSEGVTETDPTVPNWAKQTNPPTETDPTVPSWAKQSSPPTITETDPTVPSWAKQTNPPTVTDDHIEEVSERKRKQSPYLEVGDEGGVYVVIPE